MKSLCIGLIALMTAAVPLSSSAQLLKNLMNNMKQNAANKATGQQTPGTGKPDSASRSKATYDSTFMTQYLAKANKPKPSISPADSAAAIKSFMTGTGGVGTLYKYHTTFTYVIKKKDSTMNDTMSLAITDGRNTRTDIGVIGSKMELLGHAASPRYSITLNSDQKTYRFNIIDTAAISSGDGNTYQVTKVGNESVQGYNCIHSKLTITTAGQKTTIAEDIWTSTGVPGYETLKKMFAVQNVTPKMMQALESAGCGGFFIKMIMQTKEISMTMLLIGADRKNFPASMFQIPAGYTQASTPGFFPRRTQQH